MKRPPGLIITAVIEIIGSLFFVLLAGISMVVPRLTRSDPRQSQLPEGFFVGTGVFYLALAVAGIATAVGLLRLRRWARYSTLAFAGILVFFGLFIALIFAVMPHTLPQGQTAAELPSNFAVVFKTISISIQLAIAALGGWWLYYFNRQTVRSCFLTDGAEYNGTGRPLSILLLAVFNLIGVPSCLLGLWMAFPSMLFGVLVKGVAARVIYLVLLVVLLYLGIGLLRLSPASRPVAIAFYLFGTLNAVVLYFLPGREERLQRLYTESLQMWHMPNSGTRMPSMQPILLLGTIGAIAFAAVAIYFLVTRRSAFERHTLTTPGIGQPPIVPG